MMFRVNNQGDDWDEDGYKDRGKLEAELQKKAQGSNRHQADITVRDRTKAAARGQIEAASRDQAEVTNTGQVEAAVKSHAKAAARSLATELVFQDGRAGSEAYIRM